MLFSPQLLAVRRPGLVSAGGSALTVDHAPITNSYGAPGTSKTYTGVNVTAGSNRALVLTLVFAYSGSDPTGVSVNWDNGGTPQAMTLIKSQAGAGRLAQLWGLSGGDGGANAQPTVGNGLTAAIAWTNTAEVFVAGISYHGAHQTTPFPNTAGVANAHTFDLTSATGNQWVQCMDYPGFAESLAGTSIYVDTTNGSIANAAASYGDGASTVTIGLATGSHNMGAAAGVDVKAA